VDILDKIHLLNKMTSHSAGAMLKKSCLELGLKSSVIEDELNAYDLLILRIEKEIDAYPNKKHARLKDLERTKGNLTITVDVYREIVAEYIKVKKITSIPFNLKRYDLINELMQFVVMNSNSNTDFIKSIVSETVNNINMPVKLTDEKRTIKEISTKYALELKEKRKKR